MAWYGILSLLAYGSYALDKRAAIAGRARIPEHTLLFLSLLGGWPGALLAHRCLRHKSRKTAFLLRFALMLTLHALLLLAAAYFLLVF